MTANNGARHILTDTIPIKREREKEKKAGGMEENWVKWVGKKRRWDDRVTMEEVVASP